MPFGLREIRDLRGFFRKNSFLPTCARVCRRINGKAGWTGPGWRSSSPPLQNGLYHPSYVLDPSSWCRSQAQPCHGQGLDGSIGDVFPFYDGADGGSPEGKSLTLPEKTKCLAG